jgi:head-tail adaptor
MPTNAQRAYAARRREQTMDKTVVIQRHVKVSDGAGGRISAWVTHQTRKGRLNGLGRAQGQEEQIAGALQGRAGYVWTLPLDDGAGAATDVTNEDRLVLDGRGFEVRMVLERSHLTALRAVCVDVGDVEQDYGVLTDPDGGLVLDGSGGAILTL